VDGLGLIQGFRIPWAHGRTSRPQSQDLQDSQDPQDFSDLFILPISSILSQQSLSHLDAAPPAWANRFRLTA